MGRSRSAGGAARLRLAVLRKGSLSPGVAERDGALEARGLAALPADDALGRLDRVGENARSGVDAREGVGEILPGKPASV